MSRETSPVRGPQQGGGVRGRRLTGNGEVKIEPRAPPLKSWAFAPSQRVLIANVEEEKEEPVVQQLTRRYREKSVSNPSAVQPGVPWRVDEAATAAARRAPLVERHPFYQHQRHQGQEQRRRIPPAQPMGRVRPAW